MTKSNKLKRKIDNEKLNEKLEELIKDLPQLIQTIIEYKLNIPLTFSQEESVKYNIQEYLSNLNKKYGK
ncbi:MAG: hypothetical protein ACP5RX_00100 [Minisyncoccia bacterium]